MMSIWLPETGGGLGMWMESPSTVMGRVPAPGVGDPEVWRLLNSLLCSFLAEDDAIMNGGDGQSRGKKVGLKIQLLKETRVTLGH